MSLYSHISALDEVANRARNIRSQLQNSLEGLLGPMPQEAAGRAEAPTRSGVNGELQERIENLFNLMNQLEALATMLADQCVDTRKDLGNRMPSGLAGDTAARMGY